MFNRFFSFLSKRQSAKGEKVDNQTLLASSVPEAKGEKVDDKTAPEQSTPKSKAAVNSVWIPLLSTLLAGIIAPLTIALMGLPADIKELNATVAAQGKEISTLREDLSGDITEVKDDIRDIWDKLYEMNGARTGIVPSPRFASLISSSFNKRDALDQTATVDVFQDTDESMVYDIRTAQPYALSDLTGQKLLLPYTDNGKECLFYGQFNDDGHWDGPCVINVYKDGNLELITDAEYDDGKLLSSRQIFHYVTKNSKYNQDVWAVSNRLVEGEYSIGYTNLYYRYGDYVQESHVGDVTVDNVLTADQFGSLVELKPYAYYSGNTANGYFNDNTGEAYMVYYDDDQYVKSLYVGRFSNGTFNDMTGSAWWITGDDNDDYAYYNGNFRKGVPVTDDGYEYNININRVKEIIKEKGKEFDIPIEWEPDVI